MTPSYRMIPCVFVLAVVTMIASPVLAADWPQFGGPDQLFTAKSSGLADKWPDDGPRKLWSRDLGEGYSSIIAVDGVLYTMYRAGEEEVVCALNAKDGTTRWEHRYAAPPAEGHVMQFTAGPRSTPLYSDGMLYTIGVAGVMHCLDAKTGEAKWKVDLWKDFDGSFLNHGYSSSPFAYKDTVIVLVGGEGHAIMALDKKSGDVKWKKQDFKNSYSTPKLVKVGGREQLLCFMAKELASVNPDSGELYWSYPHENEWGQNICLPVTGDDNMLFFSNTGAGSRGVRLKPAGDTVEVEEVWSTRKAQLFHVNSVRIGDYVYASSGGGSPCFFLAINIKTGKLAWRERGFAKATFVYSDDKFIILDEEGVLALAKATPEKFTVLSKFKLFDDVAWTIPTLVDKTLYVRDKKQIHALDLG